MVRALQRPEHARVGTGPDRPAWWWVAGAALLVALLALALGPRPLALPARQTGDPELAAQVREALGPRAGTRAIAVALVEPDRIRTAGVGESGDPSRPQVDADSAFEIGSITKALNGMLLAALSADGVVTPDTPVDRLLPGRAIEASALGDVTLEDLAQHRSGLRSVAFDGPLGLVRAMLADLGGADPYPDWSADRLLAVAAEESTDGRGEFAYSNLGASVLGHTLAAATGDDYAALLRARVLTPMGLTATTVASSAADLPPRRVRATGYAGGARQPWIGPGYAPAGSGVWSTPADMARLLQAVINGSAPGADAATPSVRVSERGRIGLGWFTSDIDGRAITWHNGGTGGFHSWVGFDRAARRGVVVLSASDRDIDPLGEHLLGVAPPPAEQGWTMPSGRYLIAIGLTALAMFIACSGVRQVRSGRVHGRVDLIAGIATAVALLAIAWRRGPWLETSWLLWSVAAAVVGLGVAAQCWFARRLPWIETRRRWRSIGGAVVYAGLAMLLIVWIL
jgi:CubicO group peptidase (beta-lactamase class C family)